MRGYSKISPKFWTGESGIKIRELGVDSQIVALYLLTCPHANMIGVYYLPLPYLCHDIGLEEPIITCALDNLISINFCSYDYTKQYVWVHEMARYQIAAQLDPKDKRVKAVNDAFNTLPILSFTCQFYLKYYQAFHIFVRNTVKNISDEKNDHQKMTSNDSNSIPIEVPSEGLRSQEQEQNQKQEQKQDINMSGKPDVNLSDFIFKEEEKRDYSHDQLQADANEVLQFLNEKTSRCYRPVKSNLKLIMSRLASGATVVECRQVIAKKSREWRNDPKMAEYLRPATLFDHIKFEQYLGELVQPERDDKQ